MKKLFTLFLLLLLAGCSAPQVELQEVTNQSIITEIPDVVELPEPDLLLDIGPYYDFSEGESKKILGSTITLVQVNQGPEVELTIDGEDTSIEDTKSEEIIGDLVISVDSVTYSYDEENIQVRSATLKVESLDLGDNEYILRKQERITVGVKDILLEESRGDGSIDVIVYDTGRNSGEDARIKRGESLYIYGVTITNLKNYYKTEQYAWVLIE